MSTDEDHNYYSQAQRRLPDYNVDGQAPMNSASVDGLPMLPAQYYRQSQQFSTPKRPSVTTNFVSPGSHAASNLELAHDNGAENSPDPHEFYRQYRDSFRREGGSVYGGIGLNTSHSEESMSTLHTSPRHAVLSGQGGAYAARGGRGEGRSATPPRKPVVPPIQTQRGRQSSLQALVDKFNQTPDEVPPLPSNATSRSTSANQSPASSTAGPRSFKRRISTEPPVKRTVTAKDRSASGLGTARKATVAADKSRGTNNITRTAAVSSPTAMRQSGVAKVTAAAKSMYDLGGPSQKPAKPLLFGEIPHTSSADPGFGIPGPIRRRGSEGSLQYSNHASRENSAPGSSHVSPSSPTAWYMGVTPNLEGIDLTNSVRPRPPGLHRRSYSELAPGTSSKHHNNNNTVNTMPLEQHGIESLPQPDKRINLSRIPVSSRRPSVPSANEGPSFSLREEQRSTAPNPQTPERLAHTSAARKSPRTPRPDPLKQPSPRLAAFISEPPPIKSPPLRSSRPRQPVSTATTSASRARAAAAANSRVTSREKSGKSLPELGGVDLAARRERIQRAFTTKVKEKEIETEKKRQSLIAEAHMLRNLEQHGDSEEQRNDRDHSDLTRERSFADLKTGEQEQISAAPSKGRERERVLTINTGGPNGKRTVVVLDEDSPTLGTAGFLVPANYQDASSETEPNSALTSATGEMFFDHEPQENAEAAAGADSARVSREAISAHMSVPSDRSQDPDDAESIHIMLQDMPINEVLDHAARVSLQQQPTDGHDSSVTASGSTVQGPWSPHSVSSFTSGPSLRESDPYNMITRVPDSYHTQSLQNPQNIQEFQKQLLAYSPELARQGNWDPQKVTQLYLQHAARDKTRSAGSSLDQPAMRWSATSGLASHSTKSGQPESAETERDVKSNERAPQAERSSLETPVISNLKRASASLNDPDDWANTSPSMLDWIHHQAMDTPIEEKMDRPFFMTSQAKTDDAAPSATPSDPSLVLPDIQGIGGLGIDITVAAHDTSTLSSSPKPPGSAVRQSISRPSPLRTEASKQEDKPLPEPKDEAGEDFEPGYAVISRPQDRNGDAESLKRQDSEDLQQRLQRRRRTATESSSIEQSGVDGTSMAESARSSITPAEQKRLTKRRHILKEIIDTESSFGQDMTVVVDIYKGTSNVILNSPEDVKILFGNAADIVQFSMTFLDALKQASKSVYVLPKSKRWKSKRDSGATTGSTTTDDQVSIAGMDLSDDDKDRLTTIGTAFDSNLTQMEKVYTEYLKNHDAANQKLQQLQKSEKVKIWLKECRAYAHDLTTAWDLDSLLVKPVQRILKYPLLLKEILEVTPENHPDYFALDNAAREMVGVSKRINEAKRRADLVEQVNNGPITSKAGKKKETEGRSALGKAFGRRGEKIKQPPAGAENVQDRAYNAVADKFGSHFFQLQVVMRDVEMYVADCQGWVNKFNDFASAIEAHVDVGQTGYPEIESKWRRFRLSMREMQMTALSDHIAAVRKHVIDPMTTLLKLHDGPQKLMDKRKKRVVEYAKYKAIRDRGEKPDKKTTEQGEQFIAVNDTLKDELPKLFSLTGKLVEACLQNFVQLQMQWLNVWKAKLRQAIECSQLPESFAIIFDQFSGDFRYTEAQVLSLGLCNGSLLTDTANFVSFLSPDRSMSGTVTEESSRRPSVTTDDNSRSRATSNTMYDQRSRQRGMSTNSGKSPMIPSPDFGRSAEGLGLSGHLGSHSPYGGGGSYPAGKRIRASSVASGRSPGGPDGPGPYGPRNYTMPAANSGSGGGGGGGGSAGHYYGHRPSTSTGRSFESPSMSRPSYEGGSGGYGLPDRLHPDADSSRYGGTSGSGSSHRHSGVFSSAMPMSDSPRTESPGGVADDAGNLNVLFLAASVYEFNIDRARKEAGYPYLTYVAGEIFDVIGEKGELWLAKNQDDATSQIGWIWNKHFAKLAN